MTERPLVVVMGVSGSGKSTVGRGLAAALGVHFIDGDDLHPSANVTKMASGAPLTDADRWPWLADVGRTLRDYHETGLVIACSALRRIYRQVILWEEPRTRFVHLHGDPGIITSRMSARSEHFMPMTLLADQLSTLEDLTPHERGTVLDVRLPVDVLVSLAHRAVRAAADDSTTIAE
ncbi:gluconokinase [Cryobacterium tepidiphilum]|uniref:Gluconokinase n=1 Tax=Cryobacterium tepidiphilum TaxID=2486026 RepID=A0A3M8LP35_9MICO|nr:gluconokinase [Cryobacterium tepidiphilum]RNE67307.1 gluconokinase [Cryobacterium tepidiphilum]